MTRAVFQILIPFNIIEKEASMNRFGANTVKHNLLHGIPVARLPLRPSARQIYLNPRDDPFAYTAICLSGNTFQTGLTHTEPQRTQRILPWCLKRLTGGGVRISE